MRILVITTGLLLYTSGFPMMGQVMNQDPQLTGQQSIASFEAGDFRTALAGFRQLMQKAPDDVMYSYYTGRCLVELNEELDEAIEILYGVTLKGGPADANYYLGKAYQRDYNFTDAQKYYGRFEIQASRQEMKEYNIKHQVATTLSAREITGKYNPFEVMNVTFIDLFDSLQFEQIKMKGGQLKYKPAAYFRPDEKRNGLTGLMFIPPNSVRGEYLYFSGYTSNGKGGAQLFRVKKGTGRAWSDPEELKDLNTEGDEVMPYFDPIEEDLYFASNGYLGIGGYDLYRSHYDRDRDQWSEPMNLGFPVNSVMDEYLLLPGSDLGMVMFFSNRQGTDSTVTVYRVHLVEPKRNIADNDSKTLKEIATLEGAASEILAELENLNTPRRQGKSMAMIVTEPGSPKKSPPRITQVKVLEESESKPEYQITLAEALRHQAVSDSLKDLASSARSRIRDSDDPNDRWVWQKQIMLWEKKAGDEEELADQLYARVEVERNIQQQRPSVNVPETIRVDTVIGELTVYQYNTVAPGGEGEPGTPPVQTFREPVKRQSRPVADNQTNLRPEQKEPSGTVINRFDILRNSPYSVGNPIPMDVPLPQGTFYRIQLGAFSIPVEPDAFGGISPLTGESILDRGLIKYYAGKFSSYEDASLALSMIRSIGYEDAFIVAWYNGALVSTQKAKQLE